MMTIAFNWLDTNQQLVSKFSFLRFLQPNSHDTNREIDVNVINPRIAVLIAVHNEELVIERTINSLIQAQIPKSDIYIIDDKSSDDTKNIVYRTGVNLYSLPKNCGKAEAQKYGLKYFKLCDRYDWVVFLDGDTLIDKNFYLEMQNQVSAFPQCGLFVGQVKSVPNSNIFSASRAFEYTLGHDLYKKAQQNFNCIYVSPGCASMYRADVLKKLEIDKSTLAEDMDLTMQVHRLKMPIKYVHNAIVNTQDPMTLKDYIRQISRWYRGTWQVIKKHRVFGFNKKQPVDLYLILSLIDCIIFNRATWFITIGFINLNFLLLAVLIDFLFNGIISVYSAYKTKRYEVLYKFPLYYWISFINLYIFIKSFFEIIIFKKNISAWNKVSRYKFSN